MSFSKFAESFITCPLLDTRHTTKYWREMEQYLTFHNLSESWDLQGYLLLLGQAVAMPQPAGNNAGAAELIRLRTQTIKSISDANQRCWAVVCRSLDNHPDVMDTVLRDPIMILNKRSGAHLLSLLRPYLFDNPNVVNYTSIIHGIRHFKQGDKTVAKALHELDEMNQSLPPSMRLDDATLILQLQFSLSTILVEKLEHYLESNVNATYVQVRSFLIQKEKAMSEIKTQRGALEDDTAHLVKDFPVDLASEVALAVGSEPFRSAMKSAFDEFDGERRRTDVNTYRNSHRSRDDRSRSPLYRRSPSPKYGSRRRINSPRRYRDSYSRHRSPSTDSYRSRSPGHSYSAKGSGRRSPSPAVRFNGECNYCGIFGHKEDECRKKKADLGHRNNSHGRANDSSSRQRSSK